MSRPLGFIPAVMDERVALGTLLECLKIAEACCKQKAFMCGESGDLGSAAEWSRMAQQFGTLRQMCLLLGTRRPDREIHDPALIGARRQ